MPLRAASNAPSCALQPVVTHAPEAHILLDLSHRDASSCLPLPVYCQNDSREPICFTTWLCHADPGMRPSSSRLDFPPPGCSLSFKARVTPAEITIGMANDAFNVGATRLFTAVTFGARAAFGMCTNDRQDFRGASDRISIAQRLSVPHLPAPLGPQLAPGPAAVPVSAAAPVVPLAVLVAALLAPRCRWPGRTSLRPA